MSLGLHKMFIALINGILPTFLIRQINKTFFGIYYDIKQITNTRSLCPIYFWKTLKNKNPLKREF
jgi:hypothetical protein